MPVCLIGLGSNQGDRQAALDAAVAELGRHSQIAISTISRWRETSPIGGLSGQACFLNGAVKAETSLDPHELLACLLQIENRLGRRRTERWAARTIDLDLLLYDELVLNTPTLVLPHPRMAWRRFVLEPAAEVAGDMLHPTIRWTIARLLEHLHHAQPYIAVTGPIAAGKTQLAERLAETIPARPIEEQPDWTALEAFYADPAEHAWQIELGFLHQRAQTLATVAQPSSAVSNLHWLVSDFWFDQSAAFARAWLPKEQLPAYLEQYEQLRCNVMRPKLLVFLDAPANVLFTRVRHRGRACERFLTEEQLGRIRQTVLDQVHGKDTGPVLHAGGSDTEAILTEMLAATRGME